MAQEYGDVDIQSVTLGPEGSLHVEGTIVCLQGSDYQINLEARQTQGNQPVKFGSNSVYNPYCQYSGLTPFSMDIYPAQGMKPFRKGEVVLSGSRYCCGYFGCNSEQIGPEVFQVQ